MYHSGTLVNKLTLKANEYVFGLNLKRLFSICSPLTRGLRLDQQATKGRTFIPRNKQ